MQAGWASLPDSLWTRVVHAASDTVMERAVMAAQLACVSKCVRSSLLGPDASTLWRAAKITLDTVDTSYALSQADRLHRMLAAQGHRVSELDVDLEGLESFEGLKGLEASTLVGELPALVGTMPNLKTFCMKQRPPALITSALMEALPSSLVKLTVSVFTDSAETYEFPAGLRSLEFGWVAPAGYFRCHYRPDPRDEQLFLACGRQQLSAVAALQHLTCLDLAFYSWRWTSADLQSLLDMPLLEKVNLHVMGIHLHDFSAVSVPATCQLGMHVRAGQNTTHLLRQLRSLCMATLVVEAPSYSTDDELALAACCVTQELRLWCQHPGWRLSQLPLCASCLVTVHVTDTSQAPEAVWTSDDD